MNYFIGPFTFGRVSSQASGVLGGLNDVSMPPQQNMWPLPLGNVASGLFQPQPVGGTQFCAGRPSLSPTSQHSSTVSSCALSQVRLVSSFQTKPRPFLFSIKFLRVNSLENFTLA